MKLRPPFLLSDKDTFFQERRGKWAKHPQRQEDRRAPVPGAKATFSWLCDLGEIKTTPGLSFFIPKIGIMTIIPTCWGCCKIKQGNTYIQRARTVPGTRQVLSQSRL